MVIERNKEEEIVISWLRSHGYYRVVVDANHIGIEADGKMRRMIVAVRTPETKNSDIQNIIELASKTHREPWVAVVEHEHDNDVMWYDHTEQLSD